MPARRIKLGPLEVSVDEIPLQDSLDHAYRIAVHQAGELAPRFVFEDIRRSGHAPESVILGFFDDFYQASEAPQSFILKMTEGGRYPWHEKTARTIVEGASMFAPGDVAKAALAAQKVWMRSRGPKGWSPGISGPKDWTPRKARFGAAEVGIRILGNLGDARPFDYGGFVVYEVTDPLKGPPKRKWIQVDYWPEPAEEEGDAYTVYRFDVEPDVFSDLNWVDEENWNRIAETFGVSTDEISGMARSGDALERAEVYRLVGEYHGYDNLDAYPETFTRAEMEARWPEFA